MQGLWLTLFAITTGFTASGIVASLYRLCGISPKTTGGQTLQLAVLTVAGPCVIFEHAMKNLLAKEWTAFTFWLVAGGLAYWSLAIGLLVMDIAKHL